jgi:hypothetical protein
MIFALGFDHSFLRTCHYSTVAFLINLSTNSSSLNVMADSQLAQSSLSVALLGIYF